MPIAEAMEVMTRRTRSFLVSFLMVGLRILAMLLRRKSASYLKLASA
jgi:hypothetical protein